MQETLTLTGANLSNAQLQRSFAVYTDLSNANLHKTNIKRANWAKTVIRGSDLTGAVLSNANLEKL